MKTKSKALLCVSLLLVGIGHVSASPVEEAANAGEPDAQYQMGVKYEVGSGVTKDLSKARYWYAKAAGQGHSNAQDALDRLGAQSEVHEKNQNANQRVSEVAVEESKTEEPAKSEVWEYSFASAYTDFKDPPTSTELKIANVRCYVSKQFAEEQDKRMKKFRNDTKKITADTGKVCNEAQTSTGFKYTCNAGFTADYSIMRAPAEIHERQFVDFGYHSRYTDTHMGTARYDMVYRRLGQCTTDDVVGAEQKKEPIEVSTYIPDSIPAPPRKSIQQYSGPQQQHYHSHNYDEPEDDSGDWATEFVQGMMLGAQAWSAAKQQSRAPTFSSPSSGPSSYGAYQSADNCQESLIRVAEEGKKGANPNSIRDNCRGQVSMYQNAIRVIDAQCPKTAEYQSMRSSFQQELSKAQQCIATTTP